MRNEENTKTVLIEREQKQLLCLFNKPLHKWIAILTHSRIEKERDINILSMIVWNFYQKF